MDIQSRQTHLSEMGVPQWYTRFALVGAAKSPNIDVVSNDELPAVIAPSRVAKHEAKAEDAHVVEGVVDSLLGEVSKTLQSRITTPNLKASKESAVPASEQSGASEPVEVSKNNTWSLADITLGGFVSGPYIVVSEMANSMSHLEEISLLQNMMSVVDHRCAKFEFTGGFSWPVFKAAKVMGGQASMHEALVKRWLASQALPHRKVMLVFGVNCRDLIEKRLHESSENVSNYKTLFFDDSLSDIYKMPLRKKDAWALFVENIDVFNHLSEA